MPQRASTCTDTQMQDTPIITLHIWSSKNCSWAKEG